MQISISILVANANQGISYVKRLVKNFKARVLSYPNSIFEAEPCLVATLTELNDIELLRQSSLVITPNAYNEGVLYDVIPNTPLGDMNVVRATTATRVNSAGLIEVVPRNLLTYSNDFSNANWTKTASTVTAGQTGYDGTSNAWLLASTATPSAFLLQSATVNQDSVFSVYLKRGTLNWAMFLTSGTVTANFDLLNGVVGSVSNSVATIESVGNGWFRCSMKSSVNGTNVRIYPANGDNTRTITGNILIQNSQLEDSATATEYFPTTTRLNIPRIDYTNGSCPSLLVEPQRTNLFLRSEEFNDTSWVKINANVTANDTISPSGILNADKLIATAVSGIHVALQTATGSISGTTFTTSVFVKASGLSRITLLNNQGGGGIVDYNLTTSTFTLVSGVSASIQNYGNGWYRCIMTFIPNTTGLFNLQVRLADSSGNTTFTGNGVDGVSLWGFQVEQGTYPTSYIPTVASSVTRNADVISKTGISSLIGQTEGTVFVDINVDLSYTQTDMRFINISDGTSTNWWFIGTNVSNQIRFYYKTGATTYVSQLITLTSGRHKLAFAYKSNDYVAYVDGTQVHSLTSLIVGATSQIDLGNNFGGSGVSKQFINSAQLYKTRLTNAEIASLTSL